MGCKKLDISKNYESVLTVVGKNPTTENLRVGNFLATKKGCVNYFPFGSSMPGRSFNSSSYRYGFQGQEMDNEVAGVTGSHYTAEFWEYDSRLGRRWNIDPMVYPWQSSYAAFNNNPIVIIDPLGLEGDNVIESGEVKAPEGAKVEFSQGDITKGSVDLPEFEFATEDPNKQQSDNTSVSISTFASSI